MGKNVILGAGVTGLSAGYASGYPIFEAEKYPGGICSSYYIKPGEAEKLLTPPVDEKAYRFEIGGGHWIFGTNTDIFKFLREFDEVKSYSRRSSVYFKKKNLYVPFPIQNNLRFFEKEIVEKVIVEMEGGKKRFHTMDQWLQYCFGKTLCKLFFYPFHEMYTAGLYKKISPQDGYKTPLDISTVINGAKKEVDQVGYNIKFVYPQNGLNVLTSKIAEKNDIRYGKKVIKIDTKKKIVEFNDESEILYKKIISTLPLNKMLQICKIKINTNADPYTSVLVLNIGAIRGDNCPDDHWIYMPFTKTGFHRVGFYSNVDPLFLPKSSRNNNDRVSIYVEKAYPGGNKPSEEDILQYSNAAIEELQSLGFIVGTDVIDHNWIDIAYTWTWPNSKWKKRALHELEKRHIYQVGRYGKWKFQGIAESIRDGLNIGAHMKKR